MAEQNSNGRRMVLGNDWKYVFRDCDEDDGCIVIEQRHSNEGPDDEPVHDVHLPRGTWVYLMLWLQEHD